jgi:hypothetical protein
MGLFGTVAWGGLVANDRSIRIAYRHVGSNQMQIESECAETRSRVCSAVGVLLVLVLNSVDTSSHGLRFRLAYSGILGMALLLVIGLPIDIAIYRMQLHDKLLFSLPDGPSVLWNEIIQVVAWVAVSSISYLLNRSRPQLIPRYSVRISKPDESTIGKAQLLLQLG